LHALNVSAVLGCESMMALKEAGMHLAVFGATFSQSPKTLPLLKEQGSSQPTCVFDEVSRCLKQTFLLSQAHSDFKRKKISSFT
jgi:orotidine-5'-phosphate decarboxylase